MSGSDLPTIRAVAAAARVSPSTVSNYLNHPERVAGVTGARIAVAIERLGYIQNGPGVAQRKQPGDGIGLIVPDIADPSHIAVANGARIAADRADQVLLLASTAGLAEAPATESAHDAANRLLEYFAERHLRGVVFAPTSDPTDGIVRIRPHIPHVVVVGYDLPGAWCSVLTDNAQTGRVAAEHLAAVGAEKIVYFSPSGDDQARRERRQGVRDAATFRRLSLTEIATDGLGANAGWAAASALLASPPAGRLGIIGDSYDLALGALTAARAKPGLRVPEDVVVMGLTGSHRPSSSDWLGLTRVEPAGKRMGELAIDLLLDEWATDHRHKRMVLPAELRPSESTVGIAAP